MLELKIKNRKRELPLCKSERHFIVTEKQRRKHDLEGQYIYWGTVSGDAIPA